MTTAVLHVVDWIREAGAIGIGAYALVYILATLLFFPGAIVTAVAGFAYGPVAGTLVVSPVSVIAAILAFALGRSVARDWVARRMAGRPGLEAVDEAIGSSGFRIVLLLRLSPIIPFNLLNYALGLTRVRLRDYALGSLLGMLPGTLLYVYLGSLVTSATELVQGSGAGAGGWGRALYWTGLVATVAVTIFLTRVARRALRRAVGEARP